MQSVRRAVIDVGTNSVKLLVADVIGGDVQPVWEGSIQTRLGQGFYETHRLQPEPILRTAHAVAEFVETARQQKTGMIRIIATSAARDALNPGDLLQAIQIASGLKVEIISGKQEAELAFQGVAKDSQLARHPLLLLDVGGGSTEFILGQGSHMHFAKSFPLGTVRLLEKLPHGDPPAAHELDACRKSVKSLLRDSVAPDLVPAINREASLGAIELVGTGGTTSILARIEKRLDSFDRDLIDGSILSLDSVRKHTDRLWSLRLIERQRIPGLPKKRADVILPGMVIFEAVMEEFGFTALRVSTRGLRFAAVMNA